MSVSLHRRWSFMLILAVLVSLFPAATGLQARVVPPRPSRAAPAILDEGDVIIPRPAAARSRTTPASAATAVANQVEPSHTLGNFNGDFNTIRRELAVLPGPYAMTAGGDVSEINKFIFPLTTERGVPTSLETRVSITTDESTGRTSHAGLAIKARSTVTWFNTHSMLNVPTLGNTTVTRDVRVTIPNNTVTYTSAIDLRLSCATVDHRDKTHCTWTNLRFFDDLPGWRIGLSGTYTTTSAAVGYTLSSFNRTTAGRLGSDGLYGGSFLGIDTGRDSGSQLFTSPTMQMPTFAPGVPITMSVRWTRTMDSNATLLAQPIKIRFVTALRNNELVTIPHGSTQPWQTATSQDYSGPIVKHS